MSKTKTKKAFTLIELLVVIAIIAILSGVVIVNLNSAREKGQDAAIKNQMAQIRSGTIIYYDTNAGFSSAAIATLPTTLPSSNQATLSTSGCVTATSVWLDANIARALAGIITNSGNAPLCALGGTSAGKAQSWVTLSKLRSGPDYWCVDSSGNSVQKTTISMVTTSGEVACI